MQTMKRFGWLIVPASIAVFFCLLFKTYQFLPHRSDPYEWYASGGYYTGAALSISSSGAMVYSSPRSGHGDIYLSSNYLKASTKTIFSDAYEGDACISPNGKKIAYVTVVNDSLCLLLYDLKAKSSQVIGSSGDCDDPTFSADSKKILYSFVPADSPTRQVELHIYDSVTGLTSVTPYSVVGMNTGSPAPISTIYYYDGLGANGIHTVQVTNLVAAPVTSGQRAAISPQGNEIAFLGGQSNTAVCVANSNGSNARIVYTDGHNVESAHYTPDGKSLIFIEMKDDHHYNIMLCNVRTGSAHAIGSVIP